MHIEWNNALETGHADIDRDHREIVDIINRLDELTGDPCQDVIGDILCDLTEYVIVHFGREEQMMLRVHYPGYDDHMTSHCQFFASLTRFTYAYETKQHGLSREIQEYLATWLLMHETQEDAAFVRFWTSVDLSKP